jgi:hypothetical protein
MQLCTRKREMGHKIERDVEDTSGNEKSRVQLASVDWDAVILV